MLELRGNLSLVASERIAKALKRPTGLGERIVTALSIIDRETREFENKKPSGPPPKKVIWDFRHQTRPHWFADMAKPKMGRLPTLLAVCFWTCRLI